MAKAGDTTSTSNRISWDEALARAGSSEALLSFLREVPILGWHQGLYYWPSGRTRSGPDEIYPDWDLWAGARVDPATGRVIFLMDNIASCMIGGGFAGDYAQPADRPSIKDEVFAFGIELERGPVETRFPAQPKPAEPREPETLQGNGAWIAAEARRMKCGGEIPPNIRISELARKLEGRLQKAAVTNESLRPIKWTSIRNELRTWGVWPIDLIK